MIEKKFLFSSIAAVTVGIVLSSAILTSNANVIAVRGTDNVEWGHYNGVSPTLDKRGIKEYWVSCKTHEVQFTAPTTGTIIDRGTPTADFISSLSNDDSRLLKRAWNAISFSDDSDLSYVTSVRNNFSVKSIVDDSNAPDKDGKCLKLMYKDGTADFMLTEAYLDQVFSDSSVVALNFNAKCDATTGYKDISYRKQNATSRYEGNGSAYFGLNTTWKTFSYPRSAYTAYKNDPSKSTASRNTFLWLGLSDTYTTFELYLDNFHPVTKDLDWTGFEQGRHNPDAKYLSYRNSAGSETFYAMSNNSSTTLNWEWDDSIKSEGGRSVKISRAASENVYFGINRNNVILDTLLPSSSSIFSFDFRSSSTLNCNASVSSILICQNIKLSSGTNFQIPKDTWCRIAIPKSVIDRNVIFNFTGGAVCDFWVDNLQFNTDLGCFEDDTIVQANANSWSYNGEYVNASGHSNVDYTKVRTLRVLGNSGNVKHVGLSSTYKTEGNKSLWVEVVGSSQEVALYLSQSAKAFLTNNVGATIGIDVFRTSTGSLTFRDGNRTNNSYALPASNAWTHYDLTADNLTSDGRCIIFQGSNAIGDWYFDNITYNLA